jgi:hypothetical protein
MVGGDERQHMKQYEQDLYLKGDINCLGEEKKGDLDIAC